MTFDVDLHRTTITLRDRLADGKPFEMSVVDAGPEQGDKFEAPTIVFIHGFGGRAAYWAYQLEQFHESYRVLALDLRGHGYTDAPTEADGARYDVPELVGAITSYIEAHNDNPKSMVWTAKAEDILEKVRRARATLDNLQSA